MRTHLLMTSAALLLLAPQPTHAILSRNAEPGENPDLFVTQLPNLVSTELAELFNTPESPMPVPSKPLEMSMAAETRLPLANVHKTRTPASDHTADAYIVLAEDSSDSGAILERPQPSLTPSSELDAFASAEPYLGVSLTGFLGSNDSVEGKDDLEQENDTTVSPEVIEPSLAVLMEPKDGEAGSTSSQSSIEPMDSPAPDPPVASQSPQLLIIQTPAGSPSASDRSEPIEDDADDDHHHGNALAATSTPVAVSTSDIVPQEQVRLTVSPAPSNDNDKIWVNISIRVSNVSSNSFPLSLDQAFRTYAADVTESLEIDWALVDIIATSSTKMLDQKPSTWNAVYQARLPRDTAHAQTTALAQLVISGHLDTYIHDTTDEENVAFSLRAGPILDTASLDSVMLNPAVTDSSTAPNPSTEGDEGSEESAAQQDSSNTTKASSDGENRGGGNLAIILGTCLGAFAFVLAAFAGVIYHKRRSNAGEHLIDGVAAAPTSNASAETSETGTTTQFLTGAPLNPRGAHVLRNQSRILDWQLDHAEAAGNVLHVLGRNRRDLGTESSGLARGDTGYASSTELSSATVVE